MTPVSSCFTKSVLYWAVVRSAWMLFLIWIKGRASDTVTYQTVPSFHYMLHSLVKNGADVLVGQRIENRFSLPPVLDQLGLLEHPELVGDGGLAHAQKLGDVADTHLSLKEDTENLNPCGVPKNLEQLRQVV